MGQLEGLPNTFTTRQARERGVHTRDLYRWREEGDTIELSRGVFRRSDAPAVSWLAELAVATRVPAAVLCCVSAAAVHDLTDEIPLAVQIAVTKGSALPRITYPPVRVLQFSSSTFDLGLTHFEAGPTEFVRIYDPARTVVDLIRLRQRIGEQVAYSALDRYLRGPGSRRRQLLAYASELRAERIVRFALDVTAAS